MTTRNVMLYGTDEPLNPYRVLSAGPLTCGLQNGEVRHVKYDGVEVLRGIAFLIHDRNWATCKPQITALEVDERDGGFEVTYAGRCADAEQAFFYQATITGSADGGLAFQVSGEPETAFVTNRLGFVVLHPAGRGRRRRRCGRACRRQRRGHGVSRADQSQPADLRHPGAAPPGDARPLGDLHDAGRCVRVGGPAQLDRRLLQDLRAAAPAADPLYGRCRRSGGAVGCSEFRRRAGDRRC